MKQLGYRCALALRLQARNPMALIYGYAFPLVFIAAFWVLYRHEPVPLVRHLGALLTIGVLGGACFGLPTALVGEREHGVWRRYRLSPTPTWQLLASTVVTRYLLLLSAGLLQLAVAVALGATLPAHPFALGVAFSVVAFSFIGLGLMLAMLADNVPAVQALGQCVFLPMLILGGVAVPLGALPEWVQQGAAFFPGIHAVRALQAAIDGGGPPEMCFPLGALVVMGAAGLLAAVKLFRWDTGQRFLTQANRGWVAPVLGAWILVGLLAQWRELPERRPQGPEAPAVATARIVVHPWQRLTPTDTDALDFRVPSDDGLITPFAAIEEMPDEYLQGEVASVQAKLFRWGPARDPDRLRAARNLLAVLALADLAQSPLERYLPLVVLNQLVLTVPEADLLQILTWIALHPADDQAVRNLDDLDIPNHGVNAEAIPERVRLYALKFIARLTGRTVTPSRSG